MSEYNPGYQNIFDKIYAWLRQAKKDEVQSIMNLVDKADEFITAAEEVSVNEYQLSVDVFKQDLLGFYDNYQAEAEKSWYLKSLQEGMWQHLAKMTDKSQIEWSELVDDFNHDGVYHAGDVIGFGTVICQGCDKETDILHASTLLPCIECGSKNFTRKAIQ